ncbi:MAG: hypothetical protein CMJ46_07135 [Planctomyces sp.]|nr:hypothetical protein [Planctomyces sp.]
MLFSNKTKNSGKQKSKPKETSDNWLMQNLFRPFPLLWLALITALVVLAPRVYRNLPDLGEQSRYQLTPDRIQLLNRPEWVPSHFLSSVIARHQIPDNVLEPELARTISGWFSNEPWVEKVDAVTIGYPPQVTVQLSFREPVAVVNLDGQLYPIDAHAVILPKEDFAPAALELFPKLIPSKVPPPLYVGIVWEDPIIKQGAVLAGEIKPYWNSFDFVSIRAQQKPAEATEGNSVTAEPIFEIVSASGSIIIWGRGPNSRNPGELTFEEKINRLTAYQERFQGFASPSGPYEIDITHWTDISRRVLKEAANSSANPVRR